MEMFNFDESFIAKMSKQEKADREWVKQNCKPKFGMPDTNELR